MSDGPEMLKSQVYNPSVDDEDEACTQPMSEEEQESVAASQDPNIDQNNIHAYGYLMSMKVKTGQKIYMDCDTFTVGRSVDCNLQIETLDQDPVKNQEMLKVTSKKHFEIIRKPGSNSQIIIKDTSSNGTFLNRLPIGKNKALPLNNGDLIGVASKNHKHFMFVANNMSQQETYPQELCQKYNVFRELGKGACGTVMHGIRKKDSKEVAIKVINKKRVSMVQPGTVDNILNEVELLKKVDHPCIIKLEDVIDTEHKLFIILELAEGGELFDKIISKTKFQEEEAKLHFYQIVSAIDYLHSKNIAHRDLKPENVLLCSSDDQKPIVKVTDLGLSKFVDVDTHLKTFVGTPQYLAPEVLFSRVRGDGSYGLEVDNWALGVILYILLSGKPAFYERTGKPVIRQITEGDYTFPSEDWSSISTSAVDLVKQLMTVDPLKRLSARQALQHPWLNDPMTRAKAEELMDSQRLKTINSVSPLTDILPDNWTFSAPQPVTSKERENKRSNEEVSTLNVNSKKMKS